MFDPNVSLVTAGAVILGLGAYYTYTGVAFGSLREWVDKDFPELTHTPKATWLTGFRYHRHGEEKIARLEKPVCLDYLDEQTLGRFSVVGDFASENNLPGSPNTHDKDLVSYDFGVHLLQLPGGQLSMQEEYKRISITAIEPIIEDGACEEERN